MKSTERQILISYAKRVLHVYQFDSIDLLRCALETIDELYKSESHSFTKGIIKMLQAFMSHELAQMLMVHDNEEESASVRRQQKSRHLLNACIGDTCCGFVLLASFHHVQGQHYTALEILNTTLQKLTPDILLSRKYKYIQEEGERYKNSFCGCVSLWKRK